jgi:hypothetical protein
MLARSVSIRKSFVANGRFFEGIDPILAALDRETPIA